MALSFSDFPPPLLCNLCAKSFDFLNNAQRETEVRIIFQTPIK